jgi:hypothetical protein
MYFDGGSACMNITDENSFYVNYIGFGDGGSLSNLGLGDGCRIEFMYLTSWPIEHGSHRGNNNISCADIRRMMFYGFELSWLNSFCKHGWSASFDINNHYSCLLYSGNLLQTTCSEFFVYLFLFLVDSTVAINIICGVGVLDIPPKIFEH